jgi:hypothetical protein
MSRLSNHTLPDFVSLEDFEDSLGEPLDPDSYCAWSDAVGHGLDNPLPEAIGLCSDGLHQGGTCFCDVPF